jgi:hypothetical protein
MVVRPGLLLTGVMVTVVVTTGLVAASTLLTSVTSRLMMRVLLDCVGLTQRFLVIPE